MAASLSDLLVAMQNGVRAIRELDFGPSGDLLSYYKFNSLGSSPTTVVAGSTGDTYPIILAFHNPSALDVLVYPAVDGAGNTITASSSAPGGGFLVYANGGSVEISGGSTMAWFAIGLAGSTGALTVIKSA